MIRFISFFSDFIEIINPFATFDIKTNGSTEDMNLIHKLDEPIEEPYGSRVV